MIMFGLFIKILSPLIKDPVMVFPKIVFHLLILLPILNVKSSSGIKLESISAANEILSVGAFPKVRFPSREENH